MSNRLWDIFPTGHFDECPANPDATQEPGECMCIDIAIDLKELHEDFVFQASKEDTL